jgi:hypothetical protein
LENRRSNEVTLRGKYRRINDWTPEQEARIGTYQELRAETFFAIADQFGWAEKHG